MSSSPASSPASAIDKILVEQIATQGELTKCDDMIPVKYNGRPGENLSFLNRKGGDYRWHGKERDKKTGQWVKYPGHPVFVRNDGRAVIPNMPENIAILESFEPQKTFERVPAADGHKQVRGPDHPPLYERIKGAGLSVSLADLSEADQEALAERMLRLMDKNTAPKQPAPELTPKAQLQNEIQSMLSEHAALKAAENPDGKAISDLEGKIKAAEAQLKKL